MAEHLTRKDRRDAVLRDVVWSGGQGTWRHLHSHGHHFSSVMAAVNDGYLKFNGVNRFHYQMTDKGWAYINQQVAISRTAQETQ